MRPDRALGSEEAVAAAEARDKLRAVLPASAADALKQDDLFAAAEVKGSTAQRAVEQLLSQNLAAKAGSGKKGDPFKYWRGEKHSAQAPPSWAESKPTFEEDL